MTTMQPEFARTDRGSDRAVVSAGPNTAENASVAPRPLLRLALFGLPPADLCLAMLPADAGAPLPPIAVWSPDKNLNEHISSHGLSILEQPPCIQHLEQLLQISADWP